MLLGTETNVFQDPIGQLRAERAHTSVEQTRMRYLKKEMHQIVLDIDELEVAALQAEERRLQLLMHLPSVRKGVKSSEKKEVDALRSRVEVLFDLQDYTTIGTMLPSCKAVSDRVEELERKTALVVWDDLCWSARDDHWTPARHPRCSAPTRAVVVTLLTLQHRGILNVPRDILWPLLGCLQVDVNRPLALYELRKTHSELQYETQTLAATLCGAAAARGNAVMVQNQNTILSEQLERVRDELSRDQEVLERMLHVYADTKAECGDKAQALEDLQRASEALVADMEDEKATRAKRLEVERENAALRHEVLMLTNSTGLLRARLEDATAEGEGKKAWDSELAELNRQLCNNEAVRTAYHCDYSAAVEESQEAEADGPHARVELENIVVAKAALAMRTHALARRQFNTEAQMLISLHNTQAEVYSARLDVEERGAQFLEVARSLELNASARKLVHRMLDDNTRDYELRHTQYPTDKIYFETLGEVNQTIVTKTIVPDARHRFPCLPVHPRLYSGSIDELKHKHAALAGKTDRYTWSRAAEDTRAATRAAVPILDETEPMDPGTDSATVTFACDDDGDTRPKIRFATFTRLVEYLTWPTWPDLEFADAFMLTYSSFCDPLDLLHALAERYCLMPPSGMCGDELVRFKTHTQLPTRLRVFNFLKRWVQRQSHDFEECDELAETVIFFCDELVTPTIPKAAALLKRHLTKCLATREIPVHPYDDLPPPPPAHEMEFRKVDLVHLAQTMSTLDLQALQRLRPDELVGIRWTKRDKEERAPNVLRCIRHFNNVSAWVQYEILRLPFGEHAKRAQVISRFITLGRELKTLNNFNGLMALLAGLEAAPIYRLKVAWARVNRKHLACFEDLRALMTSAASYRTYRMELRRVSPPCVPYLGVFLTDLTFIEDGNGNMARNMINFTKRRYSAQVVREVQQYQLVGYDFPPDLEYSKYILHAIDEAVQVYHSEEVPYHRSLSMEPRGMQ